MKNKFNYLAIQFIMIAIVLATIIHCAFEYRKKQNIIPILNSHIEKLQTNFDAVKFYQHNIADLIHLSTIQKPHLIDILSKISDTKTKEQKDHLREELYDLLKDDYKTLKTLGVLQYHFVTPDNITFLRMHKPSKYDDNLSSVRYSFRYVNQYKKIFRGFDQGKTTHAFRNIYPVYDSNGTYLCALDISFSSDVLQDYLTNIAHLHTHLLINKSIFSVKAWKRKDLAVKYLQSSENDGYKLTMTRDHSVKKCITENAVDIAAIKDYITTEMSKSQPFSTYYKKLSDINVISFIPIMESEHNSTVAWLVSYEKSLPIAITIKTEIRTRNFLIFTIFILLYLIYYALRDKIKTEEKLKIRNCQLIQQSKLAQMGEMMDAVAHQWKQPLNAISLHTELLSSDFNDDVIDRKYIDEYQKSIHGYIEHMTTTLTEFRDFFKSNNNIEDVYFTEIFNSLSLLMKDELMKNAITMKYSCESGMFVRANKNDMKQLFMNFIVNAKDEMVKSDIPRDNRFIDIKCKKENNLMVITVKDSGNGIPEEYLEKIFEPRFTTKAETGGTGIGLYMSVKIIQKYSGDIKVYNDNGAVFKVTMPSA